MHIHDFTDSNYGHHSNMLSQVCIPNIQYLPAVMRTIFVIRTTIKQRVFLCDNIRVMDVNELSARQKVIVTCTFTYTFSKKNLIVMLVQISAMN